MEIENIENLLQSISGCKVTDLEVLEKLPYNKGHDITFWRIIDYCFNYITTNCDNLYDITKIFSNKDEKRHYREQISHEYVMNIKNLINDIKKHNITLYKFIYCKLNKVPDE